MKKAGLTSLLIIILHIAFAQVENPVSWSYTSIKTGPKKYELHMTASIGANWHVYTQDAGEGPISTSFTFTKNPLVKLEGKVKEIGKIESLFDPNFNSTLKFYKDKVDFVQKISLKSTASTVVKGTVLYMVCNDKKCLPPKEIPFSIKLDGQ
ncbi:MAG: protein-disulfide reductase DsbD domain-containing protein [Bacteroidota bacterium]